nr:hypothetical protein [Megavirus caiporensis]
MDLLDNTINKLYAIKYYLEIIDKSKTFDCNSDIINLNNLADKIESQIKEIPLSNEDKIKLEEIIQNDQKIYRYMFLHYWNIRNQ